MSVIRLTADWQENESCCPLLVKLVHGCDSCCFCSCSMYQFWCSWSVHWQGWWQISSMSWSLIISSHSKSQAHQLWCPAVELASRSLVPAVLAQWMPSVVHPLPQLTTPVSPHFSKWTTELCCMIAVNALWPNMHSVRSYILLVLWLLWLASQYEGRNIFLRTEVRGWRKNLVTVFLSWELRYRGNSQLWH